MVMKIREIIPKRCGSLYGRKIWNYGSGVYMLIWCWSVRNCWDTNSGFFVFITYVSTRDHQFKLFKKPYISRTRAKFFS